MSSLCVKDGALSPLVLSHRDLTPGIREGPPSPCSFLPNLEPQTLTFTLKATASLPMTRAWLTFGFAPSVGTQSFPPGWCVPLQAHVPLHVRKLYQDTLYYSFHQVWPYVQ
jgi:hypothetical protein